jgi:hypothetical protein
MRGQKVRWVEMIACVTAFLLVTLLSDYFQPRITYHDGRGWDGAYYSTMADQFVHGERITTAGPFVYRVGLPILAALLNPGDLLSAFRHINLVANVLILCLFVVWLRYFFNDWKIRFLLVLMLLTQWLGPFRFLSFYPATTDNCQFAFLLLGLLGLQVARQHEVAGVVWVAVAVFVGTFFREAVPLVGFATLFLNNPIRFTNLARGLRELRLAGVVQLPKPLYFLPVIAGLGALACTHLLVHKTADGYQYWKTALLWIYDKPWPTYLQAMFIVFGPALVLVLFNWRKGWTFLESNQCLLAFIGAVFVLGYVGGNDTERYLFMATPVIYVLMAKAIEDNRLLLQSRPLVLVLVAAQLIAYRAFWTIPDFPNDHRTPLPVLTVPSSHFQYLDLWSFHGNRLIESVSLAEYVLLALLLILWMNHRAARLKGVPVAAGAEPRIQGTGSPIGMNSGHRI